MMLIPPHQQNPCTGSAHNSARSKCQEPASLEGWWLGNCSAPTLLMLQFALLFQIRSGSFEKYHWHLLTTSVPVLPKLKSTWTVPLHLFVAWEKKKRKKKIKIFSNKSATLKSTITPVLHNSFANFGCDEDYHGFSLTLAPPPIDSYLWISEAVPLHISQLLLLVKNVVVSATLLFSWIQNRAWTNPKRLGLLVVTNYNSFETTSGSGYPWTADVEKLGEDIKRKDHFLCALFLILLSYSSHTGCFPRQNNGPKGYLIRLSSAALMAALPHLEEECCFSL